MGGMFKRLIRRLGRGHTCRNTQLYATAEKAEGLDAQLLVCMVDKCTGATYEAAFNLKTAEAFRDQLIGRIEWVRDRTSG